VRLRPEIIRELDLPRHGLEILPLDGTFTPMPDGDYLWRLNDHAKTRREIACHSKLDAEAYDECARAMVEMARFVKPILGMTPPDPTRLSLHGTRDLLFLLRRFQRLPYRGKYNQVQLMTMSTVDFLDQWFETDVLKATMAASGIIGTFLGIRSPGTAYVLLHHYMGEIDGAYRSWGFARGGTGAISNSIAAAAREVGAEIRTRCAVQKILVEEGRAAGVMLEDGEEIQARIVSSSVDPQRTFLGFVGREHLDGEFVEEISRYKFRGSSGKVNLALDGLPDFRCLPGAGRHLRGAISHHTPALWLWEDPRSGRQRFGVCPLNDNFACNLPSVSQGQDHMRYVFTADINQQTGHLWFLTAACVRKQSVLARQHTTEFEIPFRIRHSSRPAEERKARAFLEAHVPNHDLNGRFPVAPDDFTSDGHGFGFHQWDIDAAHLATRCDLNLRCFV